MVVLSASICTRGGKPLLSRQFIDISKDRITLLLSNFPTLINSDSSNSTRQHTSVEDDSANVRYVYQPLEEFYIVLITNKSSNILQDIDTLHLFSSTITNMLRNIDEREIFDSSFDIIDAFDEIINLGYKENLTMSQVSTFLEMDSHEEKIQEIIERNKELEATEERKRRAKEIQRKELARKNMEMQMPERNISGFGSSSQSYQPTYQPSPIIETNQEEQQPVSKLLTPNKRVGLNLKKNSRISSTVNQPLISNTQPIFHRHTQQHAPESVRKSNSNSPIPSTPKVPNNGILITIVEKINAKLSREGSIISSEIKGDLQLRINDSNLSNCKILMNNIADKKNFKTHPNVDKSIFQNKNIITVKDRNKSFPSNDVALGVLKWRITGKEEDSNLVPIVITSWCNMEENLINVNLEIESTNPYLKIENLKILMPIASEDLNLQEQEGVSYDIIPDQGTIFNILSIKDGSGNFEFSVPVESEDDLFPLQLSFDSYNSDLIGGDFVSVSGVSILDVVSNKEGDDEESLPFDLHSNLVSENYIIE
ncbi:unnamed protein product [Candida verbasci]|uniref:Coatomer subunit delta n=1 Tax=Candida verbasci TaxID=1227364 RepID=A0A9W4XBQ7_9ASCO|nr:unnamed protein product [Candida verbasci]